MASLVADYGSSESDSSGSGDESSKASNGSNRDSDGDGNPSTTAGKARLPGPFNRVDDSGSGSSSVFSNPFREEENVQSSILERHVKMTVPISQQTQVEGKRICWNYRKGRCRFGHNCKYVHDSDVLGQTPAPEVEVTDIAAAEPCPISQPPKARNKRPGLPDGLQLSKKAMKFYHKTKT